MKKVLFIASHRKDRAPGQRFRFEQYFDFLKANGYHCHLSFIINKEDDKVLYSPKHYLHKTFIAAKAAIIRLNDVLHRNDYDIIFIFREAYLTGNILFERLLKKSRAKLIFDFDDAIWHLDISEANKKFDWLKHPGKTAEIISMVNLVFAGNEYLADYARHHNNNVVIIPTTIDTSEYKPVTLTKNETQVCIGWSGSITTIKHFEMAIPFLTTLKKKYGDKICIKVIGDGTYVNEPLQIKGIGWNKQDELKELGAIDIGIMPLPDDEWAKGKCGLKGLQYMALCIATVMSPVGVNSEIIENGTNGYLAANDQEWFDKISLLIENKTLRLQIAEAGHKTVEEKYSVNAQKNNYLRYFNTLLNV